MNLSEDWRFLFPASAVFAAPSYAPLPAAASSRGPLHFSPLPPRTPLLSLPHAVLPPRSSTRRLDRLLRSFVGATSFLPRSDLDSLSETILPQPSPPSSAPSNLIAVLRRPRISSCSLILFFPYGENADHVGFVTLDATTVTGSTPVSLVVQRDGFMHPGHSIQQLATTVNEPSWLSEQEDNLEGFLLAVTMYSLNWFRVESRGLGTSALVPSAKQRFDSVIVHACWSRHLRAECTVLLESGELCWFNLDTRQGGKMKIDFGSEDDCGNWLSFDYGAQPWMVVVASSKSILLIDLRYGDCGGCKVLARVGMPGLFETNPFAGPDQYLAFCRAGFDHFHFSVVTERYLILLDVRQPLKPVLAWQHDLESPNSVAMFRLSELRPSKEHDWASNSGFAILVGSLWTGEFSVFCYGPKEQGCPENSHLYVWDLPSRFSLTSQHCSCSNGIVEELFSRPVSRDGYASQQSKNPTVGYYVLPNDLLVSETSFVGFALICLKASGKLEMQRYGASASHDDIPCDESQHTAKASKSTIFPDTPCEDFPLRYSSMKLHFLSEYLRGNLCNALVKHDSSVHKQMGQIIVSEAVSEYAEANSSSFQSVSDFLCNASIPMNIFEIACQRILNSLQSNILHVTFSRYKDMLACSAEKAVGEHLDVPTCLAHDKLRPFLLAKPSSISCYVTSKVQCPNALVGPVLPIHVLLAMEERDKGVESNSEGATSQTDYVSDQSREVLEAFDPVTSIADSHSCDGWPASQEFNDKKPYFKYEPQIEHRFTQDGSAGKEKEERKLEDPLHTSATPYQDKIFTTFVCGKARVPDSGPEQAATSLFDFGPVRMDFDTPDMEIQSDKGNVYKTLKKQFISWQNNFKPYQDFCSSHKIQRPMQ